MNILAIDPGTTQSGAVWMRGDTVDEARVFPNAEMLAWIRGTDTGRVVVIEMIASYGMPVGKETFETCVWIGRFIEAAEQREVGRLFRKDIKRHLCGSLKAKDSHIWQAILDRYGPGKDAAVGNKKQPGPLYGITSHQRAALAVGLTWLDGVRSEGI